MHKDPLPTRSSNPPESPPIREAYEDFVLSRQAMRCSPATLIHYQYSAGQFVAWLERAGIRALEEVGPQHVRRWLAEISLRGAKDTTLHAKARGVRALLRFWHAEGHIPHPVGVTMPKLEQRRLPSLDAPQLAVVLQACTKPRDRAIVHLLADTGLRRAEACALTWGDVDLASGLVRVVRGKGGKARSVVVGVRTRRVLLAYRRTVKHDPDRPLLQTSTGERLKPAGLRMVFRRLSRRTGIPLSPHALRRTFAILSLRAGMSPLHVQGLLGHSTLEMTRHYAQMVDDDLMQAHREHGPMDTFL